MRKHKLTALLAVMIITAGCAHRVGSTVPVSPWEQVMVNNAALAQVNNDVAQGVIALQQTNVLTVAQAKPILNFQELVAKDHQAITDILNQGAQTAANSTQLTALLNEIKTQGNALIASGGLGVKNPKTQQTVQADVSAMVTLVDTILTEVSNFKGGS